MEQQQRKSTKSSKTKSSTSQDSKKTEASSLPVPDLEEQEQEYQDSLPKGMNSMDVLKRAMDRWVAGGKKKG